MSIRAKRAGEFRECLPDSEIPVCNTCGKSAARHIFRPAISYRCENCVREFGKFPTVSVNGAIRIDPCRIQHIGFIHSIPAE